MRLFLFALLLASSAVPHAQARFLAVCEATSPDPALDYVSVCGCAADRVAALGATAADLDAVADVMVGDAALEGAPPRVVAAGSAVTGALAGCRRDAGIGAASDSALKAQLSGQAGPASDVPLTPEAIAAETAAAAALPPGIRTGNGTGPVQARREGKGAPIRIVE